MYTQQELKQQAHEYVQANRQAILEDLAALIAIPSVEGEAAPGAPFGEGPRKALDAALAMAGRMMPPAMECGFTKPSKTMLSLCVMA